MSSTSEPLPVSWRADLQSRLDKEETVLAILELDLDARLRFRPGLLVLTGRRLLAGNGAADGWSEWSLTSGLALLLHDHAGVGTLELHDGGVRLARWRFTLGRNPAALQLVRNFELQRAARASGQAASAPLALACPHCSAPLQPGQQCGACSPVPPAPPSTSTLFRLWRFAQPYRWQLLAGFLLTLVATAANLVPPYLTMPLMDNVLIPYQNGKPIDVSAGRVVS